MESTVHLALQQGGVYLISCMNLSDESRVLRKNFRGSAAATLMASLHEPVVPMGVHSTSVYFEKADSSWASNTSLGLFFKKGKEK